MQIYYIMYQNTIDFLFQKIYSCEPYNPLFYSSFLFIINVLVALYYGYHLYAGLFFALLITSLLQHSHYNLLTTILDKIVIFLIVFYGGYVFYNKISNNLSSKIVDINAKQYFLSYFIVTTLILTIILYCYGYLNNCFCYCNDQIEAYVFHSFMHFVGSFGHCCIMFL